MSPEEDARFREGLADVAALARADLGLFWASLDLNAAPEVLLEALLEYVPVLSARYGELAGSVAAEWYDELRAAARVPGRFRALAAELTPDEVVINRVRSASAHLFETAADGASNSALTLAALESSLTKYVLQPGRDTVRTSVFQDPSARGWRRITRPGSCDFCRMLEGRGGVYLERTVRFAAHGKCHCAAAPNWDPSAPEVDVRAYQASARTANMTPEQRDRHNQNIREWLERDFRTA